MKVNYNKKINGLCYVEDVYSKEGVKVAKVLFDNRCKLIEEVNQYLKYIRGVSTSSYNTINIKARDLCHFYNYLLISKTRISDINTKHLSEFVKYLVKLGVSKNNYAIENTLLTKIPINPLARNNKVKPISTSGRLDSKSIYRILDTVINYLEYLHIERRLTFKNELKNLKKKKRKINFLGQFGISVSVNNIEPIDQEKLITDEQIEKIRGKASRRNDYERFLYYILEKTGIRIGEALGLCVFDYDVKDIKLTSGDIVFKDGQWFIKVVWRIENPTDSLTKSHSSRQIAIKESDKFEFEMLFERYLKFRDRKIRDKKMKWLFISNHGTKLNQNTAYKRFKRTLEKACPESINDITLHSWRHTFCTQLLLEGIPMELVAKMAGHRSRKTTFKTYIHYSGEHMQEIRKKYSHYMETELPNMNQRNEVNETHF